MKKRLRSPKALAAILLAALVLGTALAALDGNWFTAAGIFVFGSAASLALMLVVRRQNTHFRQIQRSLRALEQQAVQPSIAQEETRPEHPMDVSSLLQIASGEHPRNRSRLLGALHPEPQSPTVGVVGSQSVIKQLNDHIDAVELLPALGTPQLLPSMCGIVLDERSFADSAWAGVLDARHTLKFLDLCALLTEARRCGIPVLLLQEEVASHYSADLSALADQVTGGRGGSVAANTPVPGFILAAVDQVTGGRAS